MSVKNVIINEYLCCAWFLATRQIIRVQRYPKTALETGLTFHGPERIFSMCQPIGKNRKEGLVAAKYRLFCEYTHCCGKQTLALGEVKTEDMAKNWVKRQTRTGGRPRLAEKDLILTCPVKHCLPMPF